MCDLLQAQGGRAYQQDRHVIASLVKGHQQPACTTQLDDINCGEHGMFNLQADSSSMSAPQPLFAAVLDGHGGNSCGHLCAEHAQRVLPDFVNSAWAQREHNVNAGESYLGMQTLD